jgi:hypothetical protein
MNRVKDKAALADDLAAAIGVLRAAADYWTRAYLKSDFIDDDVHRSHRSMAFCYWKMGELERMQRDLNTFQFDADAARVVAIGLALSVNSPFFRTYYSKRFPIQTWLVPQP